MIYVDDYKNADSRLITSGLAKKIPEKIRVLPFYTDSTIADLKLSKAEYLDRCMTEIHAFLAVLCKKISDCGDRFVIHEEGNVVDIVLLHDDDRKLETIKKIMPILGEFPARWTSAEICWNAVEIPGEAEKMARNIVNAFHNQYVHIGDRTGKLEQNDQGEIIFKKRFSKHYGFKIQPLALCKEYIINHSHFKRGGNNGSAFTDLSEVSYWR